MPAPQLRGKKILSPRPTPAVRELMRLRDPMRRLTIYVASLATIGFVGGLLMGTPRSTHDHVLQDSVVADEANADPETFSPIPRPQPKPVGGSAEVREEPQRDSEPAREPSNGEAVGVTGPDLPDSALRRAIELYWKGDLLSGDRVRTELTDPLERTLTAPSDAQ